MTDVHILRVFTDQNGKFGDLASMIIDEGRNISDTDRQTMARQLNTGETIFINNLETSDISVVHHQGEIGFAGVGVLGAAWLLRNRSTGVLHSMSGYIKVWQQDDLMWARAELSSLPAWNYKQVDSPSEVEAIKLEDTHEMEHTMVWSWLDEAQGIIRARTFANDWEIPEAQGNGSGAMKLAAVLDKSIEVRHGDGSVIFASPASQNSASIGGRVVEESVQTI